MMDQKIQESVEKNPIVFFAVLSGLLIVLGVSCWISEDYRTWRVLVEEEIALRQDFEGKQQRLVDLEHAQQQVKYLQKQWLKAMKSLPSHNENSFLLEEVSALGLRLGLKFSIFSPRAQERHFNYLVLPIQMDFKGTFYQLYDFLEKIAQMKRFAIVDEMHLKRQGPLLRISLVLKIYWYPRE